MNPRAANFNSNCLPTPSPATARIDPKDDVDSRGVSCPPRIPLPRRAWSSGWGPGDRRVHSGHWLSVRRRCRIWRRWKHWKPSTVGGNREMEVLHLCGRLSCVLDEVVSVFFSSASVSGRSVSSGGGWGFQVVLPGLQLACQCQIKGPLTASHIIGTVPNCTSTLRSRHPLATHATGILYT